MAVNGEKGLESACFHAAGCVTWGRPSHLMGQNKV